jgi:fatty-acyl-CoA synthase
MNDTMLNGLMMDDYPLALTTVVERAERMTPRREVVARRPDGEVIRTTYGECAGRARKLAGGLKELGIKDGERVGTLMWNQPEHLEVYFGAPLMGAVIHTLNPRLHRDELAFIAADAEDRAIIVDESLWEIYESFASDYEIEHVIVVSRSDSRPDGTLDYEALVTGWTKNGPPPCATRRAPPGGPRASSTRTGRSSCTRWPRRSPTR